MSSSNQSIKRRPSQHAPPNPNSHSSSPHHPHSQPDPASLLKRRKLSHAEALDHIRSFLKSQSSYDVFPVSFRLIVLDHHLVVKKALAAMLQHGVVSAPLWDSEKSRFAGMFTVADIIHLIQYYYHTTNYEDAAADVDHFRLQSIRDIEKAIGVPPPPLLSIHPMRPLFEACSLLIRTHARRLPLIDIDDQTGKETAISVLTLYRTLKFIAVNCRETIYLSKRLKDLGIGTYSNPSSEDDNPYHPLAWATMQTTVFDVVHMFSELGISAVPIVDARGKVINLYETVDVITLLKLGSYTALDLTIAQAIARRPPDFPGVVTCSPESSLASVFALIRLRRIHRLVVVEDGKQREGESVADARERKGNLVGIISLSDILRHLIGSNVEIGGGGVGAVVLEAVLAGDAAQGAPKADRQAAQAAMRRDAELQAGS